MKKIFFILLAGYIFCVGDTFAADLYEFKEFTLDTQPYEKSLIYKFKSDIYFKFGCYNDKTGKDDGLRFIILKKDDNNYTPIYQSKGSGDSYSLKPNFFRTDNPAGRFRFFKGIPLSPKR